MIAPGRGSGIAADFAISRFLPISMEAPLEFMSGVPPILNDSGVMADTEPPCIATMPIRLEVVRGITGGSYPNHYPSYAAAFVGQDFVNWGETFKLDSYKTLKILRDGTIGWARYYTKGMRLSRTSEESEIIKTPYGVYNFIFSVGLYGSGADITLGGLDVKKGEVLQMNEGFIYLPQP